VRLSQAWVVARHDLGLVRRRRGLLASLVALPIGVGVGFPLLLRYILTQTGGVQGAFLAGLIDAFSFWFVIGAASIPIGIASYSIVGEKLERSLEPLLATPTTDGEILLGKTLAAFLPTILAIWAGGTIYMALTDRVTEAKLGYLYYPNWEMGVILFALTPLACLLTIEISVLISSRATDVRTAQQAAGLIFIPFILLYVMGEARIVVLDTTNLSYIAGGLLAIVVGLFFVSRQTFHRDEILTRWK